MDDVFFPGVPVQHVLQRLRAAGGNEVASGKLASPESSAALAVNAFGWFVERPEQFPPLPGTEHAGAASQVEVEYCARFPWSGGRHPWLDAVVMTDTHLIGVESKRYEPFRDKKSVSLSEAYDRPVWGDNMQGFSAVRDDLRSGTLLFKFLDAAQLVKHAYGLSQTGAAEKSGLCCSAFSLSLPRVPVIKFGRRITLGIERKLGASPLPCPETRFCLPAAATATGSRLGLTARNCGTTQMSFTVSSTSRNTFPIQRRLRRLQTHGA